MGSAWRGIQNGVRNHLSAGRVPDTRAMGGILVEALLFWLLTGAMLGAIGLLLYFTRGAGP